MTTAAPAGRTVRLLREVPFTVVLVIAAAGVVFSAVRPEHWLRGVVFVGVALMIAAMFRALLSDDWAGMLAVRNRAFDALCYLLLAAGIIGIGVLLPR